MLFWDNLSFVVFVFLKVGYYRIKKTAYKEGCQDDGTGLFNPRSRRFSSGGEDLLLKSK